ncbi:MAG: hypothetical protein FWG93_03115 [Oscillospiraceae bacterium]|nr:hypothetical protein [Oscillospiraceae bacterium]
MSIPRITSAVISEYGVAAEPDVLSGTPAQNKSVFDRLVREQVAPSLNAVIDQWEAYRVVEDYDPAHPYFPLNRVMYEGLLYECLQECAGTAPPDAVHWKRISPAGGDMGAAVYDPAGRKADIFALADAICVDLGVTSGLSIALTLPAPPAPLRKGARIRYITHTPVFTLVAPQTLQVGGLEPLPVYTPFRGATGIPADSLIEAVYTGEDYRVTFISALVSHGDTSAAWTEPDIYTGVWTPSLRVCKIGGIVYLQGMAAQNLTQSGMIAFLPAGMRPGVNLSVAAAPGANGESSHIVIQTNGILYHEYKGVPWRPALCAAYPCEL